MKHSWKVRRRTNHCRLLDNQLIVSSKNLPEFSYASMMLITKTSDFSLQLSNRSWRFLQPTEKEFDLFQEIDSQKELGLVWGKEKKYLALLHEVQKRLQYHKLHTFPELLWFHTKRRKTEASSSIFTMQSLLPKAWVLPGKKTFRLHSPGDIFPAAQKADIQ